MSKNVIIYSDGTGQVGGFRFDEDRSNVCKPYRATRCSPDSTVDPREQVAFYDAGLGSQADGANIFGRTFRALHNVIAQSTGFGITRNIIDCYAALIGSLRRECVDHIIVLGEEHLRRILKNYAAYYNGVRTHRSLQKDAPVSRQVQRSGVMWSL